MKKYDVTFTIKGLCPKIVADSEGEAAELVKEELLEDCWFLVDYSDIKIEEVKEIS